MVVDFLAKAKSEYEDELIGEIEIAEKIIDMAEGLIMGLNKANKANDIKEFELEKNY